SVSGPRVEPLEIAAGQLDAARLRHGKLGRGRGSAPAAGPAAGGRHLVVARRSRGALPQRPAGYSRGIAALARGAAGARPATGHPALGPAMNGAKPLVLTEFTSTSCIGTGLHPTLQSLGAQRSGLTHCNFETVAIDTHIGEVAGVDAVQLPGELRIFDCR